MDTKSTCLKILRSVNKLRLAAAMCDVSIVIGGALIPAHKAILAATSEYFLSKLGTEDRNVVFQIDNISSSEFVQVLDFLYTGQININRKNLSTFRSIGQQLRIELLLEACQYFEQSLQTRRKNKQSLPSDIAQAPLLDPMLTATESVDFKTIISISSSSQDDLEPVELPSSSPNVCSPKRAEHTDPEGNKEDIASGNNTSCLILSVDNTHNKTLIDNDMADGFSKSTDSSYKEVDLQQMVSNEESLPLCDLQNPFVDSSPSDHLIHSDITSVGKVQASEIASRESEDAASVARTEPETSTVSNKRYYKCSHCTAKYSAMDALRVHCKSSHREKMFKCQFCPRLFIREDQCDKHMDWCRIGSPVDGRYVCPLCSYKAVKPIHVVEHYRGQHTPKYRCKTCQETFPTAIHYYEHLLQIHEADLKQYNKKVLQCESCKFKTVRFFAFKTHMNVHHKMSYVCRFCSKVFKNKTIWLRHQRHHEKPIIYECGECRFQSRYKSTLHAHQYRAHQLVPSHEQKIYQCRHCDYTHITPANIRKHEKYCKSDARPFLCSYCPRSFQHQTALTIHERLHTGLRPFKCSLCPYSSRSRPTLKSHYKHIHSSAKPYICENCGFQTKSRSNLSAHKRRCQQTPGGTCTEEPGDIGLEAQTGVELEESIADCVAETIHIELSTPSGPSQDAQETEQRDEGTVAESCVFWLG